MSEDDRKIVIDEELSIKGHDVQPEPPQELYRERPEWADVVPVHVDEDELDPVVKISYSESFRDCFGYLRAVIKSGELSERVFELTTTCVDKNPACYTVWHLRRQLIKRLDKSIDEELGFMRNQILENQKNYQVWYHRQKLIEWRNSPGEELDFIYSMLLEDPKNYHAWQYRQWFLTKFNLWENELSLTNAMLQEDCRNNSVWNQRFFVISRTSGYTEAVVDQELKFTMNMLKKVAKNESAWNYLNGVLDFASQPQKADVLLFCTEMRNSSEQNVFLFSSMLSLFETAGKYKDAKEIVAVLRQEDVPRAQYWAFREKLLLALS